MPFDQSTLFLYLAVQCPLRLNVVSIRDILQRKIKLTLDKFRPSDGILNRLVLTVVLFLAKEFGWFACEIRELMSLFTNNTSGVC